MRLACFDDLVNTNAIKVGDRISYTWYGDTVTGTVTNIEDAPGTVSYYTFTIKRDGDGVTVYNDFRKDDGIKVID